MVHSTFILLLLLAFSILVHSTLGSHVRGGDAVVESTLQEQVDAKRASNSNDIAREMSKVFIFSDTTPETSCKGRPAKRLQRKYNRQIALWQATKPSCYTYTLERVCYRCPEPALVSVNDGVVTSSDEDAPTMEEIYSMLSGCIYDCQEEYIYQCRVRFAENGVIKGLFTDETQELIDDEYEIYVRDFQACA